MLSKFYCGTLRFRCHLCARFNSASNTAKNLVRCFDCQKNFNPIDMDEVIRKINFVPPYSRCVGTASVSDIKKNRIRSLKDLKGITLIETQRRLISWQTILADFSWLKTQKIIDFPYSLHAFKAAEVGLGVVKNSVSNLDQ